MSAKVTIYTGSFCGYCAAALALLKNKRVDYEEFKVSSAPELRAQMEQLSGRQTVPQIFVGDIHVGGYDELADLEQRGQLDKMLA